MADRPAVRPGDRVAVGQRLCIVSQVYGDSPLADIEVVYLDDRDRAINEDAVWKDGRWAFKYEGPAGGYADKPTRLQPYVAILRRCG